MATGDGTAAGAAGTATGTTGTGVSGAIEETDDFTLSTLLGSVPARAGGRGGDNMDTPTSLPVTGRAGE